jgi:hypothetical protein
LTGREIGGLAPSYIVKNRGTSVVVNLRHYVYRSVIVWFRVQFGKNMHEWVFQRLSKFEVLERLRSVYFFKLHEKSLGVGGGREGLQLWRFSVKHHEKFYSFFESLNISESPLHNIKKENNLIQTPVYIDSQFVIPYTCSTHLYTITPSLHWKHSNLKKKKR